MKSLIVTTVVGNDSDLKLENKHIPMLFDVSAKMSSATVAILGRRKETINVKHAVGLQ